MHQPTPDLVALVNPRQGSDSSFELSHGNCLPLAARPFGMTHWCPQTDTGGWIFADHARRLQGFRATHQPSPWMGDYGHFTIMPQTGPLLLAPVARASTVRRADLELAPDYIRALLWRYQTTIELTPTERCALIRVSFPAGQPARLIFSTFAGLSLLKLDPAARTLSGWTRANSGGVPADFACYVVAHFSQPFHAGYSQADQPLAGIPAGEAEQLGAYAEFDASEPLTVELRLATSFIGEEQAWHNLAGEIGEQSFEQVRAATRAGWNELLGRALVQGGDERQRRTFYTCLYRTLLFPRMWHERDDAGQPVHRSPYDGQIHPGVLYADNGFWDTFRTVYPLLALLYPDRLSEIMQGWLQAAREGGWFPAWSSPGYRVCMIGTHFDAVLADAVVKGVGGFDIAAAYAAARRDAFEPADPEGRFGRAGLAGYAELGYVPADEAGHAAAATQEYAYDDFCLAQVARALGHADDERALMARAQSYRQVYDPASGLMRARLRDGGWLEPFDEFAWDRRAYIEGSAWQYSWAAPHDPAGLIALMGGPNAFAAKLERMLALPPLFRAADYDFEIHEMSEMASAEFGQYAHSNQPVHHVLYLFAAAGQPWRTHYWVRRVLSELYSPEPDGFAGDEDNGEMSAWYVLSALGLFPLCPGRPEYVLGSPLFERAELRLPGGSTFAIEARGAGPGAVYVRETLLDGAPHAPLWISHARVLQGGTLTCVMASEPDTGRTFAPGDLPSSIVPADLA